MKCSNCGGKHEKVTHARGVQLCDGCISKLQTYANKKAFQHESKEESASITK